MHKHRGNVFFNAIKASWGWTEQEEEEDQQLCQKVDEFGVY